MISSPLNLRGIRGLKCHDWQYINVERQLRCFEGEIEDHEQQSISLLWDAST